jgi:hypothetical protein
VSGTVNLTGLSIEKASSRKMLCFFFKSKDFQMLSAAVTHLVERLNLETLLKLKAEKSLICLVGIRRPTVSITEQQSMLFFENADNI